MQDFPEPLQIENGDVVITFPFEVDPQSTLGNVVVYTHNKCCIGTRFICIAHCGFLLSAAGPKELRVGSTDQPVR